MRRRIRWTLEALFRLSHSPAVQDGNNVVREYGSGQNFWAEIFNLLLHPSSWCFLPSPVLLPPRPGQGFDLHQPKRPGRLVSPAFSVRWKTDSCRCSWRCAAFPLPRRLPLGPALMATLAGWLGSPWRPKPELGTYFAWSWHHTSKLEPKLIHAEKVKRFRRPLVEAAPGLEKG